MPDQACDMSALQITFTGISHFFGIAVLAINRLASSLAVTVFKPKCLNLSDNKFINICLLIFLLHKNLFLLAASLDQALISISDTIPIFSVCKL